MTDDTVEQPKTPQQQVAPPQGGHKNPPVGPTSGRLVRDWRMDRDYEQFMPTANM